MLPTRQTRKRDPIGTAVFYPNSFPPPRRPSTGTNSPSATPNRSPIVLGSQLPGGTPPLPRTMLSTRSSSLYLHSPELGRSSPRPLSRSGSLAMGSVPEDAQTAPFNDAQEYPFPTIQASPPTQLSNLFESFNLFTPSPGQLHHGRDSAADLNILSPDALPLSDLINEALIQELEVDDETPLAIPAKGPEIIRENSPYYEEITYRRPQPNPIRTQNGSSFFIGSPGSPSPNRPIPFRQPSWSERGSARRASSPAISRSPFGAPLHIPPSPYGHPSTLSPSRQDLFSPSRDLPSYDIPNQPQLTDIFAPSYTLSATLDHHTSHYSIYSPYSNSLDLRLNDGVQTTHQHESTFASSYSNTATSEIAAQYLQHRVLHPELHDELGSGGFGFVVSAVQTGYDNIAGKEVAVKFIFKNRIHDSEYATINGEPVESFVLARCQHVGIISFLGLYQDEEFFYLVSHTRLSKSI
jgi:hypothetical protein